MTLSISLDPDFEAKLRAKADAAGLDLPTYAKKALERVAERPSLDEVLAPLRSQFDESGMTDDELGDLLEQAKHEMRAERRAREQQP